MSHPNGIAAGLKSPAGDLEDFHVSMNDIEVVRPKTVVKKSLCGCSGWKEISLSDPLQGLLETTHPWGTPQNIF